MDVEERRIILDRRWAFIGGGGGAAPVESGAENVLREIRAAEWQHWKKPMM